MSQSDIFLFIALDVSLGYAHKDGTLVSCSTDLPPSNASNLVARSILVILLDRIVYYFFAIASTQS
ncbi:hypothetical protein PTI98_009249 [Pleurotus ostreatus]|nr:hypothetical protein PTI98_009249 [Pleurotus ostreatus]